MAYVLDSRTLRLLLEEGGVLTECEIRTIPAGDELQFPSVFRETPCANRAWLKSEHLREAFAELSDLPGASTVTVYMAPHQPHLRLSAVGACTCALAALSTLLPCRRWPSDRWSAVGGVLPSLVSLRRQRWQLHC